MKQVARSSSALCKRRDTSATRSVAVSSIRQFAGSNIEEIPVLDIAAAAEEFVPASSALFHLFNARFAHFPGNGRCQPNLFKRCAICVAQPKFRHLDHRGGRIDMAIR